ncbi:MAG: SDR family NAD(P)-dependent oxidoreductase [Thermoleophilia bacterium]|nr:SDR family NAD(P)-dependent oxidoreductase [Thermoleophilia bacterium]
MRGGDRISPGPRSRALVTGGASGIGRAIVQALERAGTSVEVLDLTTGFDVADPQAWEGVGRVDAAFLNAGVITGERDIAALTDEQYRRALAVNVDGVVLGTRRMARVMRAGDAIVATASLAGLTPIASDPIYGLSKHAVVGFVRSVAPQLAERGIRINALCPAWADTGLLPDDQKALFTEADYPLLTVDEIADAALAAARGEDTGQAWVIQPGREPLQFRFPNIPGPRDPRAAGKLPPLS